MRLVIIGSGVAGYTVAKEYRKKNSEAEILIITQDSGDFYSKPQLSNAFLLNKTPEQLVLTPRVKMAEQLNATIVANTNVTALDPANKAVCTKKETYFYDKLVLACGATPIRLPLNGDAVDHVVAVNDLTAYTSVWHKLEKAKKIAILGSGLIGCELANDWVKAGYEVVVISPDETPLNRLVPNEVGYHFQKKLSEAGVQFRLQVAAEAVSASGDGYQVGLTNGERVEADLILSAVGLKPNVSFLTGVEFNQGVVVNDCLATSVPDVYAVGDVVELNGELRYYIAPILQQARALASTLNGELTTVCYSVMPIMVKTPACPVHLLLPNQPASKQWQFDVNDQGVKAVCYDEARLVGFVLTEGRTKEKLSLLQAIKEPSCK